jgi:hypothetical protein
MRNFVLFLFSISFFLSCKKEKNNDNSKLEINNSKSEWTDFNLKGNVKSVIEYTTDTEQKTETSGRSFETINNPDINLTFDKFGKLNRKLILNEDNSLLEEITYDGKDKILTSKQYISSNQFGLALYTWKKNNNTQITRRNPDGTQLEKEVYKYDNELKVSRLKFNASDIQVDRVDFKYDVNKKLTEELYFRDKTEPVSSLKIKYDDKGNKSEESSYDKDLKLSWKTSFSYNSSNFLLNAITYTTTGKIDNQQSNLYDSQNRLVEKETFESFTNSNTKEKFEYDIKNNITSWKVFKNNKLQSSIIYSYDNKNNMTSQLVYDASNTIIFAKKITYSYDENFNWIKRNIIINNSIKFFTSRKIEYFN